MSFLYVKVTEISRQAVGLNQHGPLFCFELFIPIIIPVSVMFDWSLYVLP